jgi:hypothetical protein
MEDAKEKLVSTQYPPMVFSPFCLGVMRLEKVVIQPDSGCVYIKVKAIRIYGCTDANMDLD